MHKPAATTLIISGLTALGVYRYRRHLISRLLGLPPALHDVVVERGLRIPMPDGVELVADRHYPREPGRARLSSSARPTVGRLPASSSPA